MAAPEGGSNVEPGRERRRSDLVEATSKSFEIVRSLKEDGSAGLTDIAARLGYSKSTVHRHLQTLSAEGYVAKGDDGYRVGLLFLDYGIHVRNNNSLYRVAKPKVDELSAELGEKVWLATAENGYCVHLYHAAGKHPVRTYTRDGYRGPLHAFASGKAILAFMDDERVEDIIDRRGLPEITAETITDQSSLREELAQVRERGVAFNREESIAGINAVAAPVLEASGRPRGSICIAGPANRLKGPYFEKELTDLLLGVANEIEVNLNYE